MIELNMVSKSFGKELILDNITFQVDSGEIMCVLGPSGAGKTTLIRLISGAIKADSGEIRVGDVQLPSSYLYSEMGIMPQHDALYPDLTGMDNLRFFGRLYNIEGPSGQNKKALKERTSELISLLNLEPVRYRLVSTYSSGMKKRLSLAIALIHKPKYLLLDEPTVGIEPSLRRKIWDQFHELCGCGVTIIVTTHVMDEAQKCDSTALLYNGSLVACDKTSALLDRTSTGRMDELFFMAKEAIL